MAGGAIPVEVVHTTIIMLRIVERATIITLIPVTGTDTTALIMIAAQSIARTPLPQILLLLPSATAIATNR